MFFKTMPFICMMLSSVAILSAADRVSVQQAQTLCYLCAEPAEQHDMLFILCTDHEYGVHPDCLRNNMHEGQLGCAVCRRTFSETMVDELFNWLTQDQVADPVILSEDEELAQAIGMSLELDDEQRQQELEWDEFYARYVQDIYAIDVHEQSVQPMPVQIEPMVTEQRVMQEEAMDCVICSDDLRNGDNVQALSCLHSFHAHCIGEWIAINPTCPICRSAATV